MHPSTIHLARLAGKLLSIYICGIIIFGAIYWMLGWSPQNGLHKQGEVPTFLDHLYFSVVTISTLGYGDIAPLGWSRLVASIETILGLAFVGYSISQVLSARQQAMVEYLANDRIAQTYDECLAMITDAKELIGDKRRAIQNKVPLDAIDFIYNRSNPFYPALRSVEVLNGYTAHVEGIGRASAIASRVERATHHVEELASFTRKYINLLTTEKADWRTPRTRQILLSLCDRIDDFSSTYVAHTRYATQPYKGGGHYKDIVGRLTAQIRAKATH